MPMPTPTLSPNDDTAALLAFLRNKAAYLDDQARHLQSKAAGLNPLVNEPPPSSHHARMLAWNQQDLRGYYLEEARRWWNRASDFRARYDAVILDRDHEKDPVLRTLEKATWRIERGWYRGPGFYCTPDGPRSHRCLHEFRYAIAWSLPAALAEPNFTSGRLEPHREALQKVNAVLRDQRPDHLNGLDNTDAKDIHYALWLAADTIRNQGTE